MNSRERALRTLWRGVCTVYVTAPGGQDPETGRTVMLERAVAEGVPCHLSFENRRRLLNTAQIENSAAEVTQTVRLFIDPSVELPPGSRLVVTQNGITRVYAQAGEAAVFSCHKEIPLKMPERYA